MRVAVTIGAGLSALALTFTSLLAAAQPGAVTTATAAGAEQSTTATANPGGRPVPHDNQMWRKAVWRSLDLREKANRPLFAQGYWVTAFIIAAVKRGELVPYRTDSCTRELPLAEFRQRLLVAGAADSALSAAERRAGFTRADADAADGWTTAPGVPAAAPVATGPAELLPRQLYQLDLKEEIIFDKRHSRMRHVIEALTITVPAPETAKGYDAPVASFRYADLARVFRAHPDEAIWFNPQNSAQHRNLADAFELWLFTSRITKVENPDDRDLADLNGGERAGLFAGQEAAGKLIEFEDQIWSR